MKVAYLTSRPLGQKILKFLIAESKKKGHEYIDIVCLVTLKKNQLEKSGIDKWWKDDIANIAKNNTIPVINIEKVPDFKPDIIFSVFYYDIIPEKILSCAKKGATNLHFGYLPNANYHDKRTKGVYRGRGILSFAILREEKWQAVTFHYITKKVDLGPVIDYTWNRIGKNTTVWDLQKKSEDKAYKMFKAWLPAIIDAKTVIPTLPAGKGKYHYYSNRELLTQKTIDPNWSQAKINRVKRAFNFPNRPGEKYQKKKKRDYES